MPRTNHLFSQKVLVKNSFLILTVLLFVLPLFSGCENQSSGPASEATSDVEVPEILGVSLRKARSDLIEVGLKASPSEVQGEADNAIVVWQRPEAGALVPAGSIVHLRLSPTKEVPSESP